MGAWIAYVDDKGATDESGIPRIWHPAVSVAEKWAELLAHLLATGKAIPIKDSLIATTAIIHGLAVVTRNTRNRADFVNAGVHIAAPFVG
jgi:predicted nucleic acid-binding protein